MSRRSDRVLTLIGVFKLVKVCLLVLVATGAVSHRVRAWIEATHPSHHFLRVIVERVTHASPRQMHMVVIGALFYAALFLTEGLGLVTRKPWAEYFTTILTTSFIPLELYELVARASLLKGLVIAINIAIVIYLVLQLKRDHRWPWHPPEEVGR